MKVSVIIVTITKEHKWDYIMIAQYMKLNQKYLFLKK